MQLKPTQYKVLKEVVDNDYKKRILAMDTGTGKTLVGLMLMDIYCKKNMRGLIICPPILIKNVWLFDSKRFGILKDRIIPITASNMNKLSEKGVYIISYGLFTYHAEKIKKYRWDITVIDESHYIANRGSNRTKAIIGTYTRNGIVNELKTDRIYLLTGTLIPNNEQQAYSQLRAVGFRDTWTRFKQQFFYNPVANLPHFIKFIDNKRTDFNSLISKYTTVIKKEDTELKDIAKEFRYIQFPADKKILEIQKTLAEKKIYKDKKKGFKVKLDVNIKKFVLFRELSSGFIKGEDGEIYSLNSARRAMYEEFVKPVANKIKAITWYSFEYDRIQLEQTLEDLKVKYWVLKGGLSSNKQEKIIKEFRESETGILLIQFGVGKVGLTFTEISSMIYYNLVDNNEFYRQSQDRIHRYGQTETCKYYIFQAVGTIDDAIIASLENKNNMLEGLKEWIRRLNNGK